MADILTPNLFRRIDESDDESFYAAPRLVVHIDDHAIRTIGEIFQDRLPSNGVLLDVMSSWRSHLPTSLHPEKVIGLGLNRTEMQENPALSEIVVHNLSRDPKMPFGDASFDGAVLTVSVQYLIHPLEVFREVARVLRPGAPFIVSFSNRMFPSKAVAVWMEANERQRVDLVKLYFLRASTFERIEVIDRSETRGLADPVWAVVAYRPSGEQ